MNTTTFDAVNVFYKPANHYVINVIIMQIYTFEIVYNCIYLLIL